MSLISLPSVSSLGGALIVAGILTIGASTPIRAQNENLAQCMSCHIEGEIVLLAGRMPAEQREKLLDAHLSEHFVPDSSIRAEIISYLISEIERAATDSGLEEQG